MRKSIATVSLSGSLIEKLTAASAAGFDGVELFENDLITSPLNPKEIRRRADDLGLSIDLYQPFRDAEAMPDQLFTATLRRAEQKFEVMEQLGAGLMLICSNVSDHAIDDDALAAEQLRTLADRASQHGLSIAYEALAWGRHISDYRHAWKVVEAADHPGLGMCLDSFHILTKNDDPAGIRVIPSEKIFYLQLADAPALRMEALHFSRHYRCFPGQGVFDLVDFTAHVLEAGYNGPISLEVFNDVFRQADAERTAIDAMRSLIILGDAVRKRLPQRVTLAELPDVSMPEGFAFVELTVDAFSEKATQDLLNRMGFTHHGTHRSKPVQLWQQGEARLVLNRAHPITDRRKRGDVSVSVVGVEDQHALRSAIRAHGLLAPQTPRAIGAGEARLPALTAPDGTALYFCRTAVQDTWLTDFEIRPPKESEGTLDRIDHVALSPAAENFDETLLFYRATFGLEFRSNEEIAEPHGLLRSRAVAGEHFRLVFNVPVFGSDHEPPGLQHIAFSCPDIFDTATRFRAAEVPTLPIPQNYYEDLAARTDLPRSTIVSMCEHGILYDRTADGEFYHLYSTMLGHGLFFEIVQRINGYDGFGAPNAPVRRAMQS